MVYRIVVKNCFSKHRESVTNQIFITTKYNNCSITCTLCNTNCVRSVFSWGWSRYAIWKLSSLIQIVYLYGRRFEKNPTRHFSRMENGTTPETTYNSLGFSTPPRRLDFRSFSPGTHTVTRRHSNLRTSRTCAHTSAAATMEVFADVEQSNAHPTQGSTGFEHYTLQKNYD